MIDLSTTRLAVIATVGVIGSIASGSGSCFFVSTTGGTTENARLRRTSASDTRISTTDSPLMVFSITGVEALRVGVSTSVGKLLQADNVNEINKMLMLGCLSNRTHYSLV